MQLESRVAMVAADQATRAWLPSQDTRVYPCFYFLSIYFPLSSLIHRFYHSQYIATLVIFSLSRYSALLGLMLW